MFILGLGKDRSVNERLKIINILLVDKDGLDGD